jgi:hypothetical protein
MINELREQITHAISCGSMTGDDLQETDADRLGALAMVNPLGAALWRLVSSLDSGSFAKARDLLFSDMSFRYVAYKDDLQKRGQLRLLCQQVLLEWLAGACRVCRGRGRITDADKKKTSCPACFGSGRWRSSDYERMLALGVGPIVYDAMFPLFRAARKVLTRADYAVVSQLSKQLEHTRGAYPQG